MNKTVTEIPKDSTEATKSREAQAREIAGKRLRHSYE